MKTLKLVFVAVLVGCSLLVIAHPTTSKKNVAESKKELYKDIKANVVKWGVMKSEQGLDDGELIVHCRLNENNQVEIIRVIGEKEKLKNRFIETMNSHPITADANLQNEIIAFRICFIEKE